MNDLLNIRGSILIEGIAITTVASLAIFINLELCRKIWFSQSLHWAAFDMVRTQVMGKSLYFSKSRAYDFWESAWSRQWSDFLKLRHRHWPDFGLRQGWSSTIRLRYPSFLRIPMKNFTKHHFEVTETCRFPYLRH